MVRCRKQKQGLDKDQTSAPSDRLPFSTMSLQRRAPVHVEENFRFSVIGAHFESQQSDSGSANIVGSKGCFNVVCSSKRCTSASAMLATQEFCLGGGVSPLVTPLTTSTPSHLLSDLVDEDERAARVAQDGGQLAQRLAHEPCLLVCTDPRPVCVYDSEPNQGVTTVRTTRTNCTPTVESRLHRPFHDSKQTIEYMIKSWQMLMFKY